MKYPTAADTPEFKGTRWEAGVLAMMYSLSLQLLQFKPPGNDMIELDLNELECLGEDIAHWNTASKIFEKLLTHQISTTVLSRG